jgi:hypothetical protein
VLSRTFLFGGLVFVSLFSNSNELREPNKVFDPSVLFDQNQKLVDKRANRYDLRVETGNAEMLSGTATFASESFSFKEEYKNATQKVLLSDVRTLTFKRWSGKNEGQKGVSFYPVRYDLELKNGKQIHIYENLVLFNTFRFDPDKKSGKKSFAFFSYYVDYYRDGKWVNSGEKGKSYAEEHPHPAVVRRIVFVE